MNLADTYAFTGTVSGAGKMELISSDTTGASNVAFTLTLLLVKTQIITIRF